MYFAQLKNLICFPAAAVGADSLLHIAGHEVVFGVLFSVAFALLWLWFRRRRKEQLEASAGLSERNAILAAELQNYSQLDKIINSCLKTAVINTDASDAVATILQEILRTSRGAYCILSQIDPGTGTIRLHTMANAEGAPPIDAQNFTLPFTPDGFREKLIAEKPILPVDDCRMQESVPPAARSFFERNNLRSYLAAGIRVEGRLWGVASICYTEQHSFTELDKRILQAASHILELALERRLRIEEILRSEREKALLIDNIPAPLLWFDAAGTLLQANPAAREFARCGDMEFTGHTCRSIFCPHVSGDDPCPVEEAIRTRAHFQLTRADRGHTYLICATPVFDETGKLLNVLETFTDITALENAKLQMAESLELAEQTSRAKTTFLATVSHELRTPLHAMVGFAELLKDTGLPPDAAVNVEGVLLSARTLQAIVDDVLDLSRLENGELTIPYDWMNPANVCEEIRAVFAPQAKRKELAFDLALPPLPEFYFSEVRLKQILFNLTNCAMKLADSGHIGIIAETRIAGEDELELTFFVEDTSKRLSIEERAKLLNGSGVSAERGSGFVELQLGLAIASSLVEKLGGSIRVEHGPGDANRFRVRFPHVKIRRAAPQETRQAENIRPAGAGDETVWIIDDVKMNCRVLSAMLTRLGTRCEAMQFPELALRRLEGGERPAAILTDIWMPGVNGAELAARVRKIPGCETMPIIAVTADTGVKSSFETSSFDAILLKPVRLDQLSNLFLSLQIRAESKNNG